MAKLRDAAKERFWRRMLRQHAASGLGTRRFCASQGVPEYQFHWWRRTLRKRDEQQGQSSARASAAKVRRGTAARAAFLPVRLPVVLEAPIEVIHPRGLIVRVPVLFDPAALRRILETLDLDGAS